MPISRRLFTAACFGSAILAVTPTLAVPSEKKDTSQENSPKCPNILYVLCDQLRAHSVGYMGVEPVQTPNLDAFEKESVNLHQAVSNYPVCVPYRTIMMSGKYPLKNKVYVNCFWDGREMPDSLVWWPEILKDNGYTTGYLGKWHISMHPRRYNGKRVTGSWLPQEKLHGFEWIHCHSGNNHVHPMYTDSRWPSDKAIRPEQWSPEYETDRAIEYLENKDGNCRDSSKPFMLVVSWNPPHSPYNRTYPERYWKPYENMNVEELCRKAPNVPPATDRWGRMYRKDIRHYYAAITGIDNQFGRLMRCLEKQGLKDNTLVIFTADHGNCLGRHRQISKNNIYEESMRVPLLMRLPGIIRPRKDSLLFSTVDMYPTLLDFAGLKQAIPSDLDGTNLADAIRDGKGARPKFQPYYQTEASCRETKLPNYGRRGIRTLRYVLNLDYLPSKGGFHNIMLFDLKKDPFELNNLATERPELIKQLIEKHLRPWLEKTSDPWLKLLSIPDILNAAAKNPVLVCD